MRPEPDDYTPENIPHYHAWPYAPHSDWPHGHGHRWNDSEPAANVPFDRSCCRNEDESDCLCITQDQVDEWNSYSGLSGLTAFNADIINSALSAIADMSDYDKVREGAYTVYDNSAIWNSAGYVPNIYDNLSALYSAVNNKIDVSSWSALQRVYTNSAQIVGIGTEERPLRLSKDIMKTLAAVNLGTNDGTVGLANQNDIAVVNNEISAINLKIHRQGHQISAMDTKVEILWNERQPAAKEKWVHEEVTTVKSQKYPDTFFYWDSTKTKQK